MANDPAFSSKEVLRFLMYVGLIGACLAGILYLLMQAKPQISPKVKDAPQQSLLWERRAAPLNVV